MTRILLSTKLSEVRWTQEDLVRATGIKSNIINELYYEITDRVSLEQLDLICEALGFNLDELIVHIRMKDLKSYIPKMVH